MMGLRGVLRTIAGNQLGYWCSGCEEMHALNTGPGTPCWTFNGNYDRPTFTPSVLIRSGHHSPEYKMPADGKCEYCEEAKAEGYETLCCVCHSYITDGQIQFLDDCTHKLKGKTVPLAVPN